MRPRVILDTNIGLLYVAGMADTSLISNHKRLKEYQVTDYLILKLVVDKFDGIILTPNIATEISNLSRQTNKDYSDRISASFKKIISECFEISVTSIQASSDNVFSRLGITDSAILNIISAETHLITDDLDLYLEAARRFPDFSVNFSHLRDF